MQNLKSLNKPKVIRTFCGTNMPTLNFTDPFMVLNYEFEVALLDEKYRKLIEEEQNGNNKPAN